MEMEELLLLKVYSSDNGYEQGGFTLQNDIKIDVVSLPGLLFELENMQFTFEYRISEVL